jgi:hypothetical protein
MSNRGRQNVASFLALDLGLDWRLGADWFESVLVDYDVTVRLASVSPGLYNILYGTFVFRPVPRLLSLGVCDTASLVLRCSTARCATCAPQPGTACQP